MARSRSDLPAPPSASATDAERRVVIHAPVGRDGALACELLGRFGHACVEVHAPAALTDALDGRLGVLVLTEEALMPAALDAIHAALDRQAAWSDLPIVLFVSPGHPPDRMLRFIDAFGSAANVTVLERPISLPTLSSVIDMAVRARARQYEVRDLVGQLEALNASLETRVEKRTEEVRTLAAALTLAEQHERERIAQVLHDDLQQLLFGLRFDLDALQRVDDADRSVLVARSEQTLQQAIEAARTLAIELHPPALDGEGLSETLEWAAQHMRERHGLHVDLDVEGAPFDVEGDLLVLLTRSVRELLFNVVKHAGTDHARLHVANEPDVLRLVIEDDGVGVDPARRRKNGFGLASLQRRLSLLGGRFALNPRAEGGTRVEIVIPHGVP